MALRALAVAAGAAAAAGFTLSLGPAAAPYKTASVYFNASLWSWGGSVIETPDDPAWKFHIFAASFVEGCGLTAWGSNSQVIHAVSNDALGPFQMMDVALPVWAHNPQVVRQKDGTYTLYSIAFNVSSPVANCTRHQAAPAAAPPLGAAHPPEMMSLHASDSVYGPWTLVAENIFTGTNPSPWVNDDGSVVVASHNAATVVVSTAADWRGPYSTPVALVGPREPDVNWEDPFLWFDRPAGVWRLLTHAYNATNHTVQVLLGASAQSSNASLWSTWTAAPYDAPAYTAFVNLTDGTTMQLSRRERPKLLLNATTGAPAVLYNGVCPPHDGNGCFTLGVPVLGIVEG